MLLLVIISIHLAYLSQVLYIVDLKINYKASSRLAVLFLIYISYIQYNIYCSVGTNLPFKFIKLPSFNKFLIKALLQFSFY